MLGKTIYMLNYINRVGQGLLTHSMIMLPLTGIITSESSLASLPCQNKVLKGSLINTPNGTLHLDLNMLRNVAT